MNFTVHRPLPLRQTSTFSGPKQRTEANFVEYQGYQISSGLQVKLDQLIQLATENDISGDLYTDNPSENYGHDNDNDGFFGASQLLIDNI